MRTTVQSALTLLPLLLATVAAQEKGASSTSQTDALETARAAVEKRLTAHINGRTLSSE